MLPILARDFPLRRRPAGPHFSRIFAFLSGIACNVRGNIQVPNRINNTTMKILTLLAALLALASSASSFGWSKGGHMTIAAIAFSHLSENQRETAIRILSEHPSFENWSGQASSHPDVPSGAFLFMRASLWADDIKRGGHQDRAENKPRWHYMNYPLRPEDFPHEDAPEGENILTAIAASLDLLEDEETAPDRRAIALAWLLHLVGDLHQPLHVTALFTEALSDGDRGGNDFYIRPASAAVKLHSFWDGLLGTSASFRSPYNQAIRLRTDNPQSDFPQLASAPTPLDWSLETRQLAIDHAYKDLDLSRHSKRDPSPCPEDYRKNSKALAEKQAVIAGWRLAGLLSEHPCFRLGTLEGGRIPARRDDH